jgi:phenylalanyl-tRNA synthetase beta subunit
MRVPIEWLKDFVQVDLSPDDLAERLTMAGLEVESVEDTPQGSVLAMYITPNRGDCLSIFGIAREVYALLGESARPTELFHRLNAQILNPPPAEPSGSRAVRPRGDSRPRPLPALRRARHPRHQAHPRACTGAEPPTGGGHAPHQRHRGRYQLCDAGTRTAPARF